MRIENNLNIIKAPHVKKKIIKEYTQVISIVGWCERKEWKRKEKKEIKNFKREIKNEKIKKKISKF